MPFPTMLRDALEAYQLQAVAICTEAVTRGLVPNCCFDTDTQGLTTSIEVRGAGGALLFNAVGEDPLTDLARQLGVTYPFSLASGGQKRRILDLLDVLHAPSKERAQVLANLPSLKINQARTLLADLEQRAATVHAVACDQQRQSFSHMQAA